MIRASKNEQQPERKLVSVPPTEESHPNTQSTMAPHKDTILDALNKPQRKEARNTTSHNRTIPVVVSILVLGFVILWIGNLVLFVSLFSILKRRLLVVCHGLVIAFQILVALKLDGQLVMSSWCQVFAPLVMAEMVWMVEVLCTVVELVKIVADDTRTGPKDATAEDRENPHPGEQKNVEQAVARRLILIGCVVLLAQSLMRIVCCYGMLVGRLDGWFEWNWWIVFWPLWTSLLAGSTSNCWRLYQGYQGYQSYQQTKQTRKNRKTQSKECIDNEDNSTAVTYHAIDSDDSSPETRPGQASYETEFLQTCFEFVIDVVYQVVLFLSLCLLVAKLEGASLSSLWILLPFFITTGVAVASCACCFCCCSRHDAVSNEEDAIVSNAIVDPVKTEMTTKNEKPPKDYTPPAIHPSEKLSPSSSHILPQQTPAGKQHQVDSVLVGVHIDQVHHHRTGWLSRLKRYLGRVNAREIHQVDDKGDGSRVSPTSKDMLSPMV